MRHQLWAPTILAGFVLLHASDAAACVCDTKTRILLPAATNLAPLAGPWLVMHPGDATTSLEDELGNALPASAARSYAADSLCGPRFELIVPDAPLIANGWYRLSLVGPSGNDTRAFKASERSARTLERKLTVSLESVVAETTFPTDCSNPKYDGLHSQGAFVARLEADAPALLFVSISATDSSFGELVAGGASLGPSESSAFAVTTAAEASVPRLDTTGSCARVVVRDALDVTVHDQELCPAPGKTLGSEQTVSVSEHLIREPPSAPIDDGCGCRTRPSGNPGAGLGFVLLLTLVARGRSPRRPAQGNPTSSSASAPTFGISKRRSRPWSKRKKTRPGSSRLSGNR